MKRFSQWFTWLADGWRFVVRWWRGPEHPCHRCAHFVDAALWPDAPTEWDGVAPTRDHCAKHNRETGPRGTCEQWEARDDR